MYYKQREREERERDKRARLYYKQRERETKEQGCIINRERERQKSKVVL